MIRERIEQAPPELDWLRQLVWMTRDGMYLRLSEMSDSHLANAIAWIDRHEDRLDETESHYTHLAETGRRNFLIIEAHSGTMMTLKEWAFFVKEKVAWIKLCREGMRLEQFHRNSRVQIGWGELTF